MKFTKRIFCIAIILAMLLPTLLGGTIASYSDGVFAFDSQTDVSNWLSGSHNLDYSYDSAENALKLKATGGDPFVSLNVSSIANLSATSNKAVTIIYKAPTTNSSSATMGELFLSAGSITVPTVGYSKLFNHTKNSAYIAQTIDLSSTSWWTGKINCIRIDPFCSNIAGDTMYVDSIIVAKNAATAAQLAQERINYRLTGGEDLGDMVCYSYENEKYTSPFWKGNIVYNEAIFPEADRSGNLTYTLMYEPDEICSVYNATFSAKFEEGVDFTVSGNKITFLKTGRIPYYDYTYIHPQSNPNNYDWYTYYQRHAAGDGKWELNFRGCFLSDYINVTYTHSDTWDYYEPENKSYLLPRTAEKLINKESMNVVFFGDSICGGANASSYRDLYPYAEPWTEQIIRYMKESCGNTKVAAEIISVGGSDASGMVQNIDQVTSCNPDLVFIEFGVNDGMNVSSSHPAVSGVKYRYKSAIEEMICAIKEHSPDCEIVLVSPFYPNIYCHYMEYFEAFEDALLELEEAYDGVAVANVTALMRDLLEFKNYTDFNGDNQCHPNDFAMRLYSQTCLATIVPDEIGFDAYVPEEMVKATIEKISATEKNITEKGVADFMVTASGNGLKYKWTCTTAIPDGVAIYGDTTRTLVIIVADPLETDFGLSFTCTVTDNRGNTAVSPEVTVNYIAPVTAAPGDTDGDGVLSISDIMKLRKHLADDTPSGMIVRAADVNGDGEVNTTDIYALRAMLAE